ncbi:MAG: DDE-type integrase/transposase/recombinase [Candidatus Sungbacteria bacterium]|nr:DDE-type integrase/transposase/recombinase [Candidatus Sungbacteria bacterium]
MDALPVKRSTLFHWKKKFVQGGKTPEALNEKKRTPKNKRRRVWHPDTIAEIKRIRWEHPNLGKEKIYPILKAFSAERHLPCPQLKTIGRLIRDCGGLRVFPKKVRHNGAIVPVKCRKVLRKPKDFKVEYPGHLVAFDTIEKIIHGSRRYVITFEDIHTRFSFAWATTSHASLAAKEFFEYCRLVFPFPFAFVLTDNGSEFKKHFDEELRRLHLTHYHTYPKTPKMNAHVERFNRTIQEEFIDYHTGELLEVRAFNNRMIDWLIWYNTERVHYAFQNKLSPVQFMISLPQNILAKTGAESKDGWPYTTS